MKKLKLLLGFVLLPFAYSIWILDRIIYVVNPQADHEKFAAWLKNETVLYAILRIAMAYLLRWVIYWIFGI